MEELEDAFKDKWIDFQRVKNLDEMDKLLIKSLKVAYITGKGEFKNVTSN